MMFRKMLALLIVLMGSVSTVWAAQDAVSTSLSANGPFQAANSTPGASAATSRQWDATHSQSAATSGTSSLFQTEVSLSSTATDYTTQAALMQEQKMLNLLNEDRKNNGLAPLVMDEALSAIARIKSADMRDKGYFAHTSPTYGSPRDMLRHFGYEFAGASENIAHHATVEKAQAAFMSSPGHRRNILGQFWVKVGVGVAFDKDGFIYATQLFAR